jgi:hypothetical protein
MSLWPVQDAKAPFNKLLDASVGHSAAPPSLKTLLLAPQPRFERLIPLRGKLRRRAPVKFQ